ncbi:MAG: SDR family NAD(P)-dependent oxidoreductase [Opitutales bacterium]|nr:SDR family NAD(P)-dependent oxidoreductase [Opitutales bacterium]
MDTVIITGASGEPALSIARRLCGIGIRVYALAGTIPETSLGEDEFVPVPCDPTSPDAVISAVQSVLEKEKHLIGIILAGQYLSEENFETVSPEEIRLALNAQVVSPLCAVRLTLPSLISGRGHVIVVSPGAGTTSGRTLNAVADAATRTFAGTLFAELRDTGVKTCHILLQNNEGAPDPAARFTTAPQSRIHAEVVADAVETVFRLRENNALTQMILRPQATRETPRIPISSEPKIRALQVVQLPPKKNFPPEEEPIPTPAYRRPDYAPAKKERGNAETEDDGFSDDYVDPELRYLVKETQRQPRPPMPPADPEKNGRKNPKTDGGNAQPTPTREGKNRRRNRNRDKNKNRNFDGAIRINAPQLDTQSAQPAPEKTEISEKTEPAAPPQTAPSPQATTPKGKPQTDSVPAKREKRPRKPRAKSENPETAPKIPRPPKKRKPRPMPPEDSAQS